MEVKKLVDKYRDYVISMRRYFHENPELSLEEFETTKKIAEELEKMGIEYEIPVEKTGVLGVIKGEKPGKTIALRADMDALNVEEKTGLEFSSKVSGRMHACGHDAHTAMLLGAAKILSEVKDDLAGKIYLVFQPAEETAHGAKMMMKFGNWYEETDHIFGSHVWMDLEDGKVSLEGGERMAAAGEFNVTVKGKGGHASMPNQTIDPVVVASSIVLNLQTLVSRKYSPLDALVITVGSINSGYRFNIIPEEAKLSGTTRYFNPEIHKTLEEDLAHVVKTTCDLYGAKAEITYRDLVLPTFNDPTHSELAVKSAGKIVGQENVINMEKTTGGEDFSFYLDKIPGVFAFIGVGHKEKEKNFPHHNESFNISEEPLANGAGVYAQYAIDYLNNN